MRTRLAVVVAALLCSVAAALEPASAATHDGFGPVIGPDKPRTQTVVLAGIVKCEFRKGCS